MKTTLSTYVCFLLLLGTFSVCAQPLANFTVDKTAGCSPLTANFTSTSTGNPDSYFWTFGNGNTSTNPNPSATYVQPGTYTVTLTVKDASGSQSNTKTIVNYITVYPKPTANFTANPSTGCAPLSVSFTDQTTGAGVINSWVWDFGNGNTGNSQNPTNLYSLPGSYDVTLAIKDVNGCENTVTKTNFITTTPGFTGDFAATNNTSCTAPAAVSFTSSTSTPGTYTYNWKFGDNTTSTLANPVKTYSASGSYAVELEITSSNGCKQKITKPSFVQIANLSAGFTYTKSSNCSPSIVFLTSTSGPNPTSLNYWWQVNGAQDRYSQNASYTLTNKTNIISLIVQNAAGCKDTFTQTITLNDGPRANFTVNKDVFCDFPATVNFTDLSLDSPTTWAWNFGNNIGLTTQHPTITYNAEGIFNVRLIVSKGGSCRDTAFHTITVSKPNVSIQDQHKKGGCVPSSFFFQATDNSKIPLTNWKWELLGATIATSPSFNYTFNQTGTYVVKLTASNSYGCQFIDYDTVRIGRLPNFDIVADRINVCFNPGTVSFSFIQLDTIKSEQVKWEFWNGQTQIFASDTHPTVHFNDTGYFTIKVKASNNGCTKEISKNNYIRVNLPIAGFTFTTDTCKKDTVRFFNRSSGKNKLFWDFDHAGGTSTLPDPIYTYLTPGVYKVKLIALDTQTSCTDTIIKNVNITPGPVVSFTPNDTAICVGSGVLFKSTSVTDSSQRIVRWRYTRSDNIAVGTNPANFIFNKGGVYGMTLRIEDDKNCKYDYTDTFVVKVYDAKPGFTLSPPGGCTPFLVNVKDTSQTDNPIVSRKWQFTPKDSITTNVNPTSFAYLQPAANQTLGSTITLTVTDNQGCVFKTSQIVRNTRPIPNYTISTTKSCGVDSFVLNAVTNPASAMSPVSYKWSLPGNATSSSANTRLNLSGDTTYDVKLLVTDGQGCQDSITKKLIVNTKAPKAGFDGTPRVIACYKSNPLVVFTDTSHTGGSPIVRRDWSFGNSSNIITKLGKDSIKASTFYPKPGRYPVTLKITDSIGCTDSSRIPDFIVAGGPYGNYSFTPNRGCNPVLVDFTINSPNAALYIWDHADGNVDTINQITHQYLYTRNGVYYPRLTIVDSTLTCDYGFDDIDSITVLPLPQPDFAADAKVICKDGIIIFSNQTSAHPYPITNWKWTFGSQDSVLARNPGPVLFPAEGKYMVSLEATDSNGCYGIIQKDSFVTVVDDTIPPATPLVKRATVQSNEEVLFEYFPNTEFDFGRYIIYTTNSQYTKNNIQDTALLETSLNTLELPYAYKLLALDVCRNSSGMSETHQTVELKATGIANSVALNWTPYMGFDTTFQYEIWRSTGTENTFTLLSTVNSNTTHFVDTSVLCLQTYFYHIRSVETDSFRQFSWSDTSGATPVYAPVLPTPENIRATVVNNKVVRLEWHKPYYSRLFTYHIYRSVDSGTAVLYKKLASSDTVLTDYNVDVQEHSYSYTTYVIDACGGTSAPSNIARTIVLRVHMVGNDMLKHDPKLTWSKYEDWGVTGVDHYTAHFFNDDLNEFEPISYHKADNLETRHKYINLVQSDYCYKVIAYKHGDTTIVSESNINCVSTEPRLYAPNVFTINGDNLNDIFYVKGVFIETFELKIYNRWGELIFTSTDLNKGWDGTFEGKPCKPDVFVYKAEGIGKKGQRINIAGNVTLLR